MKKLILAFVAGILTTSAISAIIAQTKFNDGMLVEYTNEQRWCPENLKAAVVTMPDKRKLKACYMVTPRGVMIMDEEGDQGLIPLEAVVPVKEI